MDESNRLVFQDVECAGVAHVTAISRARVPGGWLVLAHWDENPNGESKFRNSSITFYPDPSYEWLKLPSDVPAASVTALPEEFEWERRENE